VKNALNSTRRTVTRKEGSRQALQSKGHFHLGQGSCARRDIRKGRKESFGTSEGGWAEHFFGKKSKSGGKTRTRELEES